MAGDKTPHESGGAAVPGQAGAGRTQVTDGPVAPEASGAWPPRDPGLSAGPARRWRVGVLFAVAVFVLALDVVSKVIVVATLPDRPPIRLLGGLLTLRLIRNGGAAFSIGTSATIVFTLIAIGVIVYIVRVARRVRSAPWAIALGLLLGGAAGNLSDRIFRGPAPLVGHVVDWIELPHWPVFNLGDASICCGGALIVLLAILGMRLDGTRERRGAGEDAGAGERGDGSTRSALRARPRGP